MVQEFVEQGTVKVGDESVGYEIRIVDARSRVKRKLDTRRGHPDGNIIVVIPGHGQTVHGPKKLAVAAAKLSRSKIAWCIDPIPARGGDWTEAQAIAEVVRERIWSEFPAKDVVTTATIAGWSHGGSEALRTSDYDHGLFPQYLGLCPTGIVERRPSELLWSFCLEALQIVWACLRRLDFRYLGDTLRLGLDAAAGLLLDLWRTKSLKRIMADIAWAAKRVTGRQFGYPGEVVFLFGVQDTVVRWGDAFPDCERPEDIPKYLAAFWVENVPRAERLEVEVVAGDHVGPEGDAATHLKAGLGLLGQLDGSAQP